MDIKQCKEIYESLKKGKEFIANIDKDFFLNFAEILFNELDRLKKYEDLEWQEFNELSVANAELKKKDKVINEMSIYVNSPLRIPEEKYCEFYNSDEDCCWKTDKECKDCKIEYFTNKVEREGK